MSAVFYNIAGKSKIWAESGPFVTIAGGKDRIAREPRVRLPKAPEQNAIIPKE